MKIKKENKMETLTKNINYKNYIQNLIEEDIEKKEEQLKNMNDGDMKTYQKNKLIHVKKLLEDLDKVIIQDL